MVDFRSLCHFQQTITLLISQDFLLLISFTQQFVLVNIAFVIIVFFKWQLLVFCFAVLSSCTLGLNSRGMQFIQSGFIL